MTFERQLDITSLQDVPHAIRERGDLPGVGGKIVVVSLTEGKDDEAYRIVTDPAQPKPDLPPLMQIWRILPGILYWRYLDGMGVTPDEDGAWNPHYATLTLHSYQELCQDGILVPKGRGGEAALKIEI